MAAARPARWVGPTAILFALAMVLLLTVLVIAARRARPDRPPTILRQLVGGVHVLRGTRRTLAVLALPTLGEAAEWIPERSSSAATAD